jgi:ferritin-like metal-binding protein YciE
MSKSKYEDFLKVEKEVKQDLIFLKKLKPIDLDIRLRKNAEETEKETELRKRLQARLDSKDSHIEILPGVVTVVEAQLNALLKKAANDAKAEAQAIIVKATT